MLQKLLGFLRLIHCHQNLRQANACLGITWLQLYRAGVTLASFLQIVSLQGDIAESAFSLLIRRIRCQRGLVLFFGSLPALWSRQGPEHIAKFEMDSRKLRVDLDRGPVVVDRLLDVAALGQLVRHGLVRSGRVWI